jgi:hypothetical protein
MIYARSELLFPHRYVSALCDVRGGDWKELVDRIRGLPEDEEESIAFCFLLVEMSGCLRCDMNSYKASLGCRQCACRAIASFKGSDEELVACFVDARDRVHAAMAGEVEPLVAE